jgi:hypothetical protein
MKYKRWYFNGSILLGIICCFFWRYANNLDEEVLDEYVDLFFTTEECSQTGGTIVAPDFSDSPFMPDVHLFNFFDYSERIC